jgi:SAM-dependent methyltransferase
MNLKQLASHRVFWSRIRCSCCGGHVRRQFSVVWDGLAEEWELTPELRRLMDQREGRICAFCRANWRVQHLASVLLDHVGAKTGGRDNTIAGMRRNAAAQSVSIAEINKLAGLHKALSGFPGLTYSEFGGENSQDLMALTYADATFDFVLTSDTLEHVPDFDLALSEIRRVLKPQGKHIFTIPILWDRGTRQRAEVVDGALAHHLPPSHHGSGQSLNDDYLVFNEFGADVIERIERARFSVTLVEEPRNELVVTIVATKARAQP